jgi:hypothetical protein
MSWGERSCRHYGKCPIPAECTYQTCNSRCRMYENNGTLPEHLRAAGVSAEGYVFRKPCGQPHRIFGNCTGTLGHKGPHHVGRRKWGDNRP